MGPPLGLRALGPSLTDGPAAPRPTDPQAHYRPALDGVRAVAVYLVVLFHGGSDRWTGGFVGVDVFFVLSGFLVTQLLLRDLSAGGTVPLRRFYARRFRRLLPAAAVVLVVTALVFSALATPVEVAEAQDGFRAAFLYVSNWFFLHEATDYFAADLDTNPVLHFWSLAVEEQFYLVWPLVLGGLWRLTRTQAARQAAVLRAVVGTVAVASLVWALALQSSDPSRAYYGTDARAYQLMAGALVALTPGLATALARHPRAARGLSLAALGAIAAMASSWFAVTAIERGAAVTLATVVLVVALEAARTGPAHRALSTTPIVYLGRISYGTYLWHWPVIVVIDRAFDLSVVSTIALTALVATALASITFELLEHPIRTSPRLDRHRLPVIGAGLAVSASFGVLLVPAIFERATDTTTVAPGTAAPAASGFTPVPEGLDLAAVKADFPELVDCYDRAVDACTIVEGTGPHLLLMGDSHAEMVIPTLVAIAEANDLTLSVSVHFVCPWQRDLYAVTLANAAEWLERCQLAKDDLYDRVVPALDPDVVVVMNRGYEQAGQEIQYRGPDQRPLAATAAEFDPWLEETTTRSVEQLEAGGRRVVLLEPIPYGDLNPLTCLSEATVVEACRYVANAEPSPVEALYRRLDEGDDQLWSVDLDQLVCPFLPVCDPIVDGQVVKTDWTHLTSTYARSLAPSVAAYLTDNRIVRLP